MLPDLTKLSEDDLIESLPGAVVDMVRLGTTHMSYRALRPTWLGEHRVGLFVAGVAMFWLVALVRYREARRLPNRRLRIGPARP